MSLHDHLVRVLAVAVLMTYDVGSHAQDVSPTRALAIGAAVSGHTGKERLSDKASDEQRIDDCKVPPERRGLKHRPVGCARDDVSGAPAR